MNPIEVHSLPAATVEVFARRARAGGRSTREQVRQELIALARRRTSIDSVVEFLEAEGRDLTSGIDMDAAALIQIYDLPADALARYVRRARAAANPLADYIRQELIALARRGSHADVMLELAEAQQRDPSLNLDLDAIAASVRYARGE